MFFVLFLLSLSCAIASVTTGSTSSQQEHVHNRLIGLWAMTHLLSSRLKEKRKTWGKAQANALSTWCCLISVRTLLCHVFHAPSFSCRAIAVPPLGCYTRWASAMLSEELPCFPCAWWSDQITGSWCTAIVWWLRSVIAIAFTDLRDHVLLEQDNAIAPRDSRLQGKTLVIRNSELQLPKTILAVRNLAVYLWQCQTARTCALEGKAVV